MDQAVESLGSSQNLIPPSQNPAPGWQNCLTCPDLGVSCNGPSLRTIGNIASARAFHKALAKMRTINTKRVAEAVKDKISEATVYEYFSNADKDFKWTTVFIICDALISICGDRVGLPPLSNPCPASSSEIRAKLATADLKLAEAKLLVAKHETTVADLQSEIIAVKQRSAERIDQIQSDHVTSMTWMRKQLLLWQVFSFALLIMAIVMLVLHTHS